MTFKIKLFILAQFLYLIQGNLLCGQSTDLILNQTVSGVQLYEATNLITLQYPFICDANNSGQMVARIIPTIANSEYIFTETTESTSLNVNTSYPVGSINSSVSVGPTGAANISIPIDLPPGRSGMAPQLSLVYNSHSGEGLMGLGWALAGLSSITRAPTNFYHEGYIDGVDFDSNDRFSLDGQRLLSISEFLYKTEIDAFSSIFPVGSATNPDYFSVYSKNGLRLFYGNTSDSRVEAQNTSNAYAWMLNKVVDRNENFYTIAYSETNLTGEIYPISINYTGYGTTAGDYTIEFGYQTRSIPIKTYINGSQVMINKLLNLITIKYESIVVAKYQMIYTDSKLTEVIKYGKNNSRINSTIIEWGETDTGLFESPKNTIGLLTVRIQGDYNGDGRTDLVIMSSSGLSDLFLADRVGTLNYIDDFSLPTNFAVVKTGDFNGDGLEDLLVLRLEGNNYYYSFLISNGNSFITYNSLSPLSSTYITDFHTGDFNGNGKSDVLIKYSGGINQCVIHEFTFPPSGEPLISIIGQTNMLWGSYEYTFIKEVSLDMNGNGKTDLMILDTNGSRFYELQDGSLIMSQIASVSYPTAQNINLFGDYNGDGKTDIFSFDPYNNWKICISKGNSFDHITNYSFSGFNPNVYFNNYYSHDMNGDGKSDIVVIGTGTSIYNPVKIHIGYSDGQNFTLQSYTPVDAIYISLDVVNADYNHFGDYDGDGVSDFYYEDGSNARLINTYRDRNQFMVSDIINGFGYRSSFRYSSLAHGSRYTKGNSSEYPVIDYQGPIYVVGSLHLQNPDKTTSMTSYSYEGATIHRQGKGFLGFENIVSFNYMTNLQSIQEYDYNHTYFNSFLKKTALNLLKDSLEVIPIFEENYTNSITPLGGKRIFPFVDAASITNFQTGVSVSKDFTYDNDGNLTYQREDFDDNSYNIITYSDFCSAGTPLINSKPQTISSIKKHFHDSQEFSQTTTLTYNSTTGKVTSQNLGPLTTTYNYDSYGNLTYVTVSDGTISRTNHFEYDAKNMFVWKSYNALNHVTVRTYDYATGNILTETAPNTNLITVNQYNDFGQLFNSTVSALGQSQTITCGWTTGTRPATSVYYREIVTNGAPTVKEYYDALGRVIKSQKTGFDGNLIYSSNVYNNLGQLIESSTPWKQGETPLKIVFEYDNLGLKIKESSDAGTVLFGYSDKKSQIYTSGGQNSSKTTDSQGNIITSTDNGGTITYTYKSIGKPGSVSNNGSTWTMLYDNYGRQTSLSDPNAGTINYQYNNFGEITQQTDSKGITFFTYDVLGRVSTEVSSEGTKTYLYDPAGKPGLLRSVTYPGGSVTLTYDNKSRLTSNQMYINGSSFTTSYIYDIYSRDSIITYPSTFGIKNIYNNFGYLDEVRRKDNNAIIWNATSMNSFDQYTQYEYGNNLTTTKTFDCMGSLRSITTGSIQNLGYSFDEQSGNLISRKDNLNSLIEIFSYDILGRLTEVSGPIPLSTSFANNGNISSKTSVGDYSYGTKPHAVTGVTNPEDLISSITQRITYTSFSKADSIIEGNHIYTLTYGFDNQRTMSKLFNNGTLQKTVYYAGNYEREDISGTYPRHIHYIYGGDGLAAIYTSQYSEQTMQYVHKDHLGSLDKVTNSSGSVIQSTSFDAWGRRRNPTNWTYTSIPLTTFSRGYTGHEHLDLFSLINMNGRMYDPILGRFLSPDNFVQASDFTQSYNRYSYCLNNPMVYTDPSGELFIIDDWVIGFFKGLFDSDKSENAWQSANRHAGNSAKIWGGLFASDKNLGFGERVWQTVSRFIWETPQTLVGFLGSHGTNMFGQVESVTYYGGSTVVERRASTATGTHGSFIIASNGVTADPYNKTFQHEYGHYLQSRATGWMYYSKFGLPSAVSAGKNSYTAHGFHPVEQDANVRGLSYFMEYEEGFTLSDWEFDRSKRGHPIDGFDPKQPFDSDLNQNALNNARISLAWYDYLMFPLNLTIIGILIPGFINSSIY